MRRPLILLLTLLALSAPQAGWSATPAPAEETNPADELLSSLTFKSGEIELPNGVAKLNVPENFRYIGPEDTRSATPPLGVAARSSARAVPRRLPTGAGRSEEARPTMASLFLRSCCDADQ